jgi:MinD superfamily P-loop ATPase
MDGKMIVSIASGKGGTGKTFVATNLARAVAGSVLLLDCDVEEPNAHLFLKPEFDTSRDFDVDIPVVDTGKCTYCGKCAEICQFKAIAVLPETVLTFPELCHSCGGCFEVCPENALSHGARNIGVVEEGNSDGVGFVHGRLRIGEAMAPPLITAVKAYTQMDGLTIIDAPPGTSCPVIAAMRGTDFVLMVTEPTPFGLHDLKLAVEAVKILGIPCGLIINRADMGTDATASYARQENIPILMQIPFERRIAEAYARGQLIVEAFPEWKAKFGALPGAIESIIAGEVKPG